MDLLFLIWLSMASVVTPVPPVMLASSLIDIGVENPMGAPFNPSAGYYILLTGTTDKIMLTGTTDKVLQTH